MSDDRTQAITLIAFVGSCFSPYYAWSGREDPLNHCCVNVALYGRGGRRWAMTERGRGDLERSPDGLRIGPSALHWHGDTLVIQIDERAAPLPRRIAGVVRLTPQIQPARRYQLDGAGGHGWQPIAPRAHIEVSLRHPSLTWAGEGYLDSNFGREPLEKGFSGWSWSRARHGDGALVLYDTEGREGGRTCLSLRFDANGAVRSLVPPPAVPLPRTLWRLSRVARADPASQARVLKTLEDTPFYARSLVDTTLYGLPVLAFHESLSLRRFRSPLVRVLLPFRMPRALNGAVL